jgi:hypothetical protein
MLIYLEIGEVMRGQTVGGKFIILFLYINSKQIILII